MVLETHMKLCVTEPDFLEKGFCPKNWGNGLKVSQKQGFLNLLKNVVINFYWICSLMKIYIVFCVPAQMPYLGTFLFLRYGPEYSQPIRLQDDTNSHKLKVDQKLFGWPVWSWDSKIDCTSRMNGWNELIFCMLV